MTIKSAKLTPNMKRSINYISLLFGITFVLTVALATTTLYFDDNGLHASLFDDAMISYRYAHNIVYGIGPYWNAGDKVEGFTNPLWTYIMSFLFWISGKNISITPFIIQIICAFLISINVAFCSFIAYQVNGSIPQEKKGWTLLASISPLLFYPNIYWTIMGMENALITPILCVLFSMLFLQDYMPTWSNKKPVRFWIIFTCVLIGQLSRPDFLLAPVAFSASYFLLLHKNSLKNLFSVNLCACYLALAVAGITTLAWRAFYFESTLSNTYVLKLTGVPLYIQILSGIGFVSPFIVSSSIVLLMGIILGVAERDKESILVFSSGAYFILVLLYQIRVGGDPWPYWRMFTGAMVVIIYAIALTMVKTSENYSFRLVGKEKSLTTKLIIVFLLGCLLLNYKLLRRDFVPSVRQLLQGNTTRLYQVNANHNNISTALALSKILPAGSTIGVFWAGTIPAYLPNYYAADFLGKSDAKIAKMQARGGVSWLGMLTVLGHNKYDLEWTLSTYDPAWIQRAKWGEDDLTKNPKFTSRYTYCPATTGYLHNHFAKDCPS